jgi:TetR/AcrR family transcriptional repressor of nem operon
MTKGEQTKQRIVSKAASLFNANGYEGISMSDVMEATGLEKGGLYRHFSSKEELAAEAFDYAWNSARVARLYHLDLHEHAVDKLKQFIANFVERRPDVQGGCPLLNTAVDADDGNQVLRDRVREALKSWQELLASIIDDGKAAGQIRKEIDPRALADLIISCLEGSLVIARLERNDDARRNARAHLEAHLENHVRATGR